MYNVVNEPTEPKTLEPLNTKRLRYFTRLVGKRERSDEPNSTENQSNAKRVRVIVIKLLLEDSGDFDFEFSKLEQELLISEEDFDNILETAFPIEVIYSIKIPRTYKEVVEDLKHVAQQRAVIAKEMLSLYTNSIF